MVLHAAMRCRQSKTQVKTFLGLRPSEQIVAFIGMRADTSSIVQAIDQRHIAVRQTEVKNADVFFKPGRILLFNMPARLWQIQK
jgi:hypothetical protein